MKCCFWCIGKKHSIHKDFNSVHKNHSIHSEINDVIKIVANPVFQDISKDKEKQIVLDMTGMI